MINFKDMGLEKFSKNYENMNPHLSELAKELYKENQKLPDKDRLSNAQLDLEVLNNTANAFTGLDLKNKNEGLVKQEILLQEILHDFNLTQQEVKDLKEKDLKEIFNKVLNDGATKATQAVQDVPEKVDDLTESIRKEVEHAIEVSKEMALNVGNELGVVANADESRELTEEEKEAMSFDNAMTAEEFLAKKTESEDKPDAIEILKRMFRKNADPTLRDGVLQGTLRGDK